MCVGEAATSTLLVILEDRTVTFNNKLQSPHLKYHVIRQSISERMRPRSSSSTAELHIHQTMQAHTFGFESASNNATFVLQLISI